MYLNRITLIGFLGSDAEVRTANNSSFTVLSLATKSSYKEKKSGQFVSHTEWHRAIVWGKLAEYAKTLTKGTHLQLEGELRSREYTEKNNANSKRRVWEIRVDSILKLDRAEKASPEEASAPPAPEEVPFRALPFLIWFFCLSVLDQKGTLRELRLNPPVPSTDRGPSARRWHQRDHGQSRLHLVD